MLKFIACLLIFGPVFGTEGHEPMDVSPPTQPSPSPLTVAELMEKYPPPPPPGTKYYAYEPGAPADSDED